MMRCGGMAACTRTHTRSTRAQRSAAASSSRRDAVARSRPVVRPCAYHVPLGGRPAEGFGQDYLRYLDRYARIRYKLQCTPPREPPRRPRSEPGAWTYRAVLESGWDRRQRLDSTRDSPHRIPRASTRFATRPPRRWGDLRPADGPAEVMAAAYAEVDAVGAVGAAFGAEDHRSRQSICAKTMRPRAQKN